MALPNIALNPLQSDTVTATPIDTNGNSPALMNTSTTITWSTPDTSIISMTPAADGLSALITAKQVPGTATVTVSGFNPQGVNFANSFTVTVQALPAVAFKFTFGVPS